CLQKIEPDSRGTSPAMTNECADTKHPTPLALITDQRHFACRDAARHTTRAAREDNNGFDDVARRGTDHAGGTGDDVRRPPAQGSRIRARSPCPDRRPARPGATAAVDLRRVVPAG